MSNIQELIPFNNACDDLVNSRYILVDMKINSILNIIDRDNKLRDIINYCCDNLNYSNLIKLSCMKTATYSKFVLPTEEKAIICIVYNLLYQFSNKDIGFYDFLNEYYDPDNTNESFNLFARTVIEPFKLAINSMYDKRYVIVDSNEYQDNYYNKIKSTIKSIFEEIDSIGLKSIQKDELNTLLNSLYLASDNNDKKTVFAIMIGLEYFSKANKKAREVYSKLEDCFRK